MEMSLKKTLAALLAVAFILIVFVYNVKTPSAYESIPLPSGPPRSYQHQVSYQSITPLNNTKHLLVSAYMDQRVAGFDVRIIGIFRRDSIQALHCVFLCGSSALTLSPTTPANILGHADHFNFPFATTDVLCPIPQSCNATHVTLVTRPDNVDEKGQTWLPIRNRKTGKEENGLKFDFTVCVSNLFGDYNNVLQFAQTLEMYSRLNNRRCGRYADQNKAT